ncbi:MAG: hypothetical protein ACFFD4_11650 [Candidatus Odinarchaeota archaeon]
MIPKDLLKRITSLESYQCRLRGGESFCILNPDDCPCGIKDKMYTVPFENGEVIAAPNAVLINVKLTFKEELDEFIFERIRSHLSEQKNQPVTVLKRPASDEYSISFLVHYDQTKHQENHEKIETFFNNFQSNLAQTVVQGKMVFNKFLRQHGSSFYR